MKKIVEGIAIYLVFVFHPKTLVGLARERLEIEKMTQEMAETTKRLHEAIEQTRCTMESMCCKQGIGSRPAAES
jgi:fibronectin type 3 domain-containing protein